MSTGGVSYRFGGAVTPPNFEFCHTNFLRYHTKFREILERFFQNGWYLLHLQFWWFSCGKQCQIWANPCMGGTTCDELVEGALPTGRRGSRPRTFYKRWGMALHGTKWAKNCSYHPTPQLYEPQTVSVSKRGIGPISFFQKAPPVTMSWTKRPNIMNKRCHKQNDIMSP